MDKVAYQNQTAATCLIEAHKAHQGEKHSDGIDNSINSLDLISADPESSYRTKIDDLGEWFSGSPSWLGRS